MVESYFTINVGDKAHLEKILVFIKRIRQVQDARRVG
jgi:hypothetical protein